MMLERQLLRSRRARRGSATVAAIVSVVAFVGITGAFLAMAATSASERNQAGAQQRAALAARSGIAHTVANLNTEGMEPDDAASAAVGGAKAGSVSFSHASYWTDVADNGDGTWTVTSTGSSAGAEATVQVVVQTVGGGAFANAIFAGNSDEDPLYVLDIGGWGGQADLVDGDVYSGGHFQLSGDAAVTGTVRANGHVMGTGGESNATQPPLDVDAMNYEHTADYDVAKMFEDEGEYGKMKGKFALQLPESNPAHILRKNPLDQRLGATSQTAKDDYFLEDPYENVRTDPNQNGKDATRITMSGVGNEPGEGSNEKVFYIDGNLWVHNLYTYSFKFKAPQNESTRITFAVKGNVYISDNLFYQNKNKDGIAFVALKDGDVEDSGNIYFGDPEFGTLREMNAYMYAENNFYDYNLNASGSSEVKVVGNMTAGNQVLIERDYYGHHTKLEVEFDERLSAGDLDMPGIPAIETGGGSGAFEVLAWLPGS